MTHQENRDAGQTLGDRVRISRERMRTPEGRRWTQGDLAAALDVNRNTVSRWENDAMLPRTPSAIATLARALNVSADWLLGGSENGDRTPATGVGERPETPYGKPLSAESLPGPAADIVLRYLDRLGACGCTSQQLQEAERILVTGARNMLARRPFGQRDMREIIGDIDAAWDFVTNVLRRQGMRP